MTRPPIRHFVTFVRVLGRRLGLAEYLACEPDPRAVGLGHIRAVYAPAVGQVAVVGLAPIGGVILDCLQVRRCALSADTYLEGVVREARRSGIDRHLPKAGSRWNVSVPC